MSQEETLVDVGDTCSRNLLSDLETDSRNLLAAVPDEQSCREVVGAGSVSEESAGMGLRNRENTEFLDENVKLSSSEDEEILTDNNNTRGPSNLIQNDDGYSLRNRKIFVKNKSKADTYVDDTNIEDSVVEDSKPTTSVKSSDDIILNPFTHRIKWRFPYDYIKVRISCIKNNCIHFIQNNCMKVRYRLY